MNGKYVFMFNEGDKSMKETLGGKGANLAEMVKLGLPVPNGFTVSTQVCNSYFQNNNKIPEEIVNEILSSLNKLEQSVGKKLGDANNPLLVSVRSGARVSMPGMMDTILNLGMNDEVCKSLAKSTKNPKFAYDSYRRVISMYAEVVMGVPIISFERFFDEYKTSKEIENDINLSAIDLKEIVKHYKEIFKRLCKIDFPQDPKVQLIEAIKAVFDSWENDRARIYRKMNDIPSSWGTAVNVQQMVYGNMGPTSGTGVAFTRNPSNGENKLYGEFLINAQGEDVVAGIRTPESIEKLKSLMPEVYEEFLSYAKKLETYYKDMQDMEFTVENGKLYMLQTRNGKRTGPAALKIAVEMVKEGILSKEEALLKVDAKSLDQLLHPGFDLNELKKFTPVATGLAASPGCASGKICFSAEEAIERKNNGEEDLILVRLETSPEDIEGMNTVNGVLTIRGGMTSHAAVVARGMGKCCISGCSTLKIDDLTNTLILPNGDHLNSNDYLSLNGTTGEVYSAKISTVETSMNENFLEFMTWTDEVRRMKIRANADTPEDARLARKFGAEGIGLCRTEHMFFEKSRILNFRKMILATNAEERKEALFKLLPTQRKDFEELFEETYPNPVVIRYLDPPLHEFLPKNKSEILELASEMKINHNEIIKRIDSMKEVNPMMGHRGCRLLITYPEIIIMQTRAIAEAVINLNKKGKIIKPEIMIPLIGDIRELNHVRKVVDKEMSKIIKESNIQIDYKVGTMIEVPRACLTSREIANVADFYSFGTNDLTQMTFGFSRDDSAKFLSDYYSENLYDFDPFVKLDNRGVGKLIEIGVREGRRIDPNLSLGICGEQGADPSSVEFFERIGMDYVSCSPYRIPCARLAAAQASIKANQSK